MSAFFASKPVILELGSPQSMKMNEFTLVCSCWKKM